MWDLVNEMWPVEARPKLLQSRRVVEKMTIAEISQFKAHYEQEEEKKGGGAAVFGKDKKLRAVEFKKGKDNGTSKLHEARFELRMLSACQRSTGIGCRRSGRCSGIFRCHTSAWRAK